MPKYPPPHPVFLKEHAEVLERLRAETARANQLSEQLFRSTALADKLRRAMNGGPTDPWVDSGHPGHVLLRLGWQYHPDEDEGMSWIDSNREDVRMPLHYTLPEALSLALQRVLDNNALNPSMISHLMDDD